MINTTPNTNPNNLSLHPTSTYPTHLHIRTLNCWGLKYISTHRRARLIRIGHELSLLNPTPHIICLQECWTQADYLSICASLPTHHSKYYHSGIFGGGLAIFSLFPIVGSSMLRYPLNGRPTAFFRGDWFVGKGIAVAQLRVGPGENDIIEVLNTHLHAPYEREPHDSYICHRTAQAWEIAKVAREARAKGRLVLAVGDFNMIPASLAHQIVTGKGGVRDSWTEVHPEASVGDWTCPEERERRRGRGCPTVRENLGRNGATCDTRVNTWRMREGEKKRVRRGEDVEVEWEGEDRLGKRLDYIFYSGQPISAGRPLSWQGQEQTKTWKVDKAKVGMLTRHPTLHCSLSDHLSVEATLSLSETSLSEPDHRDPDPNTTSYHTTSSSPSSSPTEPPSNGPSNRTSPPSNTTTTPSHNTTSPQFLPLPTYNHILSLIKTYTAREQTQRKYRLTHFTLSLLLTLACLVAIFWSPHNYVSFILMLISTFGLAAGLLDGLIGGFFVGSELRALGEFAWEVENERARAVAMLESQGLARMDGAGHRRLEGVEGLDGSVNGVRKVEQEG